MILRMVWVYCFALPYFLKSLENFWDDAIPGFSCNLLAIMVHHSEMRNVSLKLYCSIHNKHKLHFLHGCCVILFSRYLLDSPNQDNSFLNSQKHPGTEELTWLQIPRMSMQNFIHQRIRVLQEFMVSSKYTNQRFHLGLQFQFVTHQNIK